MHSPVAWFLGLSLVAAPAWAQRLTPPTHAVRPPAANAPLQAPRQPDDIAGTLLGATVGALAGTMLFVVLNRCDREECSWDGLERGIAIGWSLGAPLGAHVGNARRGSLFWGMFGSVAAGAVGHRLAAANRGDWLHFYAMLGQIVVATAVERATGAGHAPRDTLTLPQPEAR